MKLQDNSEEYKSSSQPNITLAENPHSPLNRKKRKQVMDSDNAITFNLQSKFIKEEGPMFKALLTHIDPSLSKGKKIVESTNHKHQDIHRDLELPENQWARRNDEDHPNLMGREQPDNKTFVEKWKTKK